MRRGTDTQTRVTNIHFASYITQLLILYNDDDDDDDDDNVNAQRWWANL